MARYRSKYLLVLFALFQRGDAQRMLDAFVELTREGARPKRVRCPACAWQPGPSSRWYCADCPQPEQFFDGCGAAWNTFETGGLCPGCGHRWRWTSCLRCAQWSLHKDWYADDPRPT